MKAGPLCSPAATLLSVSPSCEPCEGRAMSPHLALVLQAPLHVGPTEPPGALGTRLTQAFPSWSVPVIYSLCNASASLEDLPSPSPARISPLFPSCLPCWNVSLWRAGQLGLSPVVPHERWSLSAHLSKK